MTDSAPSPKQPSALWQALRFAWDFGLVVVIPLVALAVAGRFLDRKFGTTPWIFLAGVIVSIVISTILVVMRLNRIISQITNRKP